MDEWVPDGAGIVVIEGNGGDNIIDCSTSEIGHEIYGRNGRDTLIGSDFIDPENGSGDFIAGGGGSDCIYGGAGGDAIDGGADDDEIYGEDGNDVIFGGVGSAPASGVGCELQTAFIALGSSYLTKGGSGDDTIHGGYGNDCIDAGSGEDWVYGEAGNDTLEGGNHSDVLDGGPGKDTMDGGWHTDTCIADQIEDTFIDCELEVGPDLYCGDDYCDDTEDSCYCPEDCGPPLEEEQYCSDEVDDDCDTHIDCTDTDCSSDPLCSPASDPCGNGTCDLDEDCLTCPSDCAGKQKGKPANRFCCGDGTKDDAEGNGAICNGNY